MRFKGFYWIEEWDGTWEKVSAREERTYLDVFLKYGFSYWIHITYSDGVTHRVSDKYFEKICRGHANPNVIH